MIIEQNKDTVVLQEGLQDNDTIKMSLDIESSAFIMQMLSKNLYQEPISSTIREIC